MHQVYGLSPTTAPMTALKKIKVGDKEVWSGNVTANTQLNINQPNLFGGDKKEGGIVGLVDVEFGGASQGVNSYLASKLTGYPVPAFRGLAALVLRSPQVSALNPYIKPWSAYWVRTPGGFYPAKASIGDAMNPAHIIYELLTSNAFGIGMASGDIDTASFIAAADTLYSEGLMLAFFWEGEQETEEFIHYVLQHIDGSLHFSPATGKLVLKLARGGYNIATLPILDSSNVLRVDRFSQPLPGELVSEVQVKFEDQATGEPGSVTVQDIAILEMQGGSSVPVVRNYRGLINADQALKVALRELRQLATPLARAEILCNRDAWNLAVGDVFRLQWPPLGILDMVMRVAEIDYGTLTNGQITITAIQDVFSAASTVIGAPTPTGWTHPVSSPAACPVRLVMEAPYWVVAREVLGDMPSLIADVDASSGLVLASGSRPTADAYDYRLLSRTGSASYTDRAGGSFMPVATLAAAVGRTETVFSISGGVDLDFVEAGSWAHVDGELVKVVSVTASTLTVARGVLDTVPAPHAAGVAIHFTDDAKAIDTTEWSDGQTVNVKLLTRTGLGTLLEASAPADSVVMAKRFIRPYPPGKVRINGASYPASASGDLAITWAHRDRTQQTAYLVEQNEGDIGPEPGTTYTLRIYNAQTGGSLIRTFSGIAGTGQAYTEALATSDNGGTKPANVRIEIESARDGHTSWQRQVVPFAWL
jgi:hypothetical protein